MKHPTPQAIREAMDRMEAAALKAHGTGLVAMNYGTIQQGDGLYIDETHIDVCGTVACHGGWYALAALDGLEWENPIPGEKGAAPDYLIRSPEECGYTGYIASYAWGADKLAQDLLGEGSSQYDLQDWAHENPHLWGNEWGNDMFSGQSGPCAFGGSMFSDAFPLSVVIDHWRAVADRIEALPPDWEVGDDGIGRSTSV